MAGVILYFVCRGHVVENPCKLTDHGIWQMTQACGWINADVGPMASDKAIAILHASTAGCKLSADFLAQNLCKRIPGELTIQELNCPKNWHILDCLILHGSELPEKIGILVYVLEKDGVEEIASGYGGESFNITTGVVFRKLAGENKLTRKHAHQR